MSFSSIHSQLMEKIVPVYIECSIRSFPVDCFSILRHYGFKLFPYSSLKKQNQRLFELCSSFTGDAFRYEDIIAYNEKRNQSRICFSLMHEFGHYILGHREDTRTNEDKADEFASNFIAPRIAMHRYRCLDAERIHNTFGLSYAASNRAIADYRVWFEDIARSHRQPSPAEKRLEAILFPHKPETADLRRDDDEGWRADDMFLVHGDDYLFWSFERQRCRQRVSANFPHK